MIVVSDAAEAGGSEGEGEGESVPVISTVIPSSPPAPRLPPSAKSRPSKRRPGLVQERLISVSIQRMRFWEYFYFFLVDRTLNGQLN